MFVPQVSDACALLTPEDLLVALGSGQLSVLFQPKCDREAQRVVGAEALLRWYHPRHGLIPTAAVISIAERSGLIFTLGQWILDRSCNQLRQWRELGETEWAIAVNVSPLQLKQPGYSRKVREVLAAHQIPPERLILEITESTLMQEIDVCREQLLELSSAGVRISLDDFGTGFSSLAQLKELPISEVKLDMAFVIDIDRNEVAPMIVSAIVRLASNLNLRVVAEGVEREQQLRTLLRLGCDETQGLLHAPAITGSLFLNQFGRSRYGGEMGIAHG